MNDSLEASVQEKVDFIKTQNRHLEEVQKSAEVKEASFKEQEKSLRESLQLRNTSLTNLAQMLQPGAQPQVKQSYVTPLKVTQAPSLPLLDAQATNTVASFKLNPSQLKTVMNTNQAIEQNPFTLPRPSATTHVGLTSGGYPAQMQQVVSEVVNIQDGSSSGAQ